MTAQFVSPEHAHAEGLRLLQSTAAAQYRENMQLWKQEPKIVSIGIALDQVFSKLKRMPSIDEVTVIFRDHVGDAMLKHVWIDGAPKRGKTAALRVGCDHPVWRTEFQRKIPALRAALVPLGIIDVTARIAQRPSEAAA